jgi:magnesium chelatase family protein
VETLKEAWDILIHQKYKHLTQFEAKYSEKEMSPVFFPDPRSRLPLPVSLERVIGISAAGGHHILLLGPKGVGKSLAFEWLIGLLPSLTPEDRLQQRLMAELSSNSPSVKIHEKSAPFPVRRVSSQVRPSALVGGTSSHSIRPGEFSLAHGGVLIADELPEWHRDSREVFREPLERGRVSLTRTQGTFDLPANFLLAANGNLCPCGGWPPEWAPPQDSIALSKCRCRETIRRNYLARLSGPILDRIDLVSFVTYSSLPQGGGSTGDQKWNQLQTQVQEAREFLKQTWGEVPGKLNGIQLEGILDSSPLLRKSVESLEFSSFRSRHKTLRTALTLSAWDHLAIPHVSHLREAYCYRADRLSPTS